MSRNVTATLLSDGTQRVRDDDKASPVAEHSMLKYVLNNWVDEEKVRHEVEETLIEDRFKTLHQALCKDKCCVYL